MTLARLALRNLTRNRFRATLTALAVAIAVLAFLVLRTVISAWTSAIEYSSKERLVTRHKVTFVMTLPMHYVDEVRRTPHVVAVTWADWFGGKDPKHETDFFNTLAVDPKTYFAVYDEMKVPHDALEAFQHDRQGAIVGDILARKFGWKPGDRIALRSGLVPQDLQLTIDGVYEATAKSVDRSTLCFHWDYMNESVAASRKDTVGWIVSRIDDPSRVAEVGAALDRRFEDESTPTLSQDEHTFNASFMGMFSGILAGIDVISGIILLIMTLILGNTVAMGVRERTHEYAVFRTIGFLPARIVLIVAVESVAMGALGGMFGALVAWPFIDVFMGRIVDDTMGAFFPYFRLEAAIAAVGVCLAIALSAAASVVPAWQASRVRVVDAVRRLA